MSQTKKIQGRLFRGENGRLGPAAAEKSTPSRSSSDTALTIEIPKINVVQPPGPAPPKTQKTSSEPSPKQEHLLHRHSTPFRQRLAQRLGSEYNGAERHRLGQDCDKELHWKRWGPYLSDRQWVSAPPPCQIFAISDAQLQHAGRRLSVKTTPPTVMPGPISHTNTRVHAHTGGEKTVLLGYPITTNVFAYRFRSGTVKTTC